MINYFPTRIAKGQAFCNRVEELKRLKYNITAVNPSLIISPRRYGKTSLVMRALEQIKWPFAQVDLYKAFSEKDIEKAILNGIGVLLGKLESAPKKLVNLAAEFFSALHVSVSIESSGLSLDFSKSQNSPTENILRALNRLHELAEKRNKKIILYLDEFQVVGEVCPNYAIEAAIREVAQQSEYIAFIFSGSDRHMMGQLFNDKKRPFYKLCDTITLHRISAEDYSKHLQTASFARWEAALEQSVIDLILHVTKRHAYYFNKLCSILWQGSKPTPEDVRVAWVNFVMENKSVTERELSLLTINQRKILSLLADTDGIKEPFGKLSLAKLDLSNSSAARAMKLLMERDYVYIEGNSGQYCILDPMVIGVLVDRVNW